MSSWICDVCSKRFARKFCLTRHQIVHKKDAMDRKGVHLPMIDDGESDDVSSEEDEAMESSGTRQEVKDDIWDVIIDYTYGKMRDKLQKKKDELMRQDSELTSEEALQMANEALKSAYEQQLSHVFKSYVYTYDRLKSDPTYKKVMQTAKRYREDDDMDLEESIRKAIRKRRHLLEMKLEEYDEPSLSSDEETDGEQSDNEEPPKKKQRKK